MHQIANVPLSAWGEIFRNVVSGVLVLLLGILWKKGGKLVSAYHELIAGTRAAIAAVSTLRDADGKIGKQIEAQNGRLDTVDEHLDAQDKRFKTIEDSVSDKKSRVAALEKQFREDRDRSKKAITDATKAATQATIAASEATVAAKSAAEAHALILQKVDALTEKVDALPQVVKGE